MQYVQFNILCIIYRSPSLNNNEFLACLNDIINMY